MTIGPKANAVTRESGETSGLAACGMVRVERALAEFRAGRPVLLCAADETALAAPAESLDLGMAQEMSALADGPARLVLPAARLRRLGVAARQEPGAVTLAEINPDRVATLALTLDARLDAAVAPARPLDRAALELSALALLLPPVVVAPLRAGQRPPFVAAVTAEEVAAYRRAQAYEVRLVSRAPVPLEGETGAIASEFVVFRGGEGMRDQVAIIVGAPDLSQPVAVRLHSACLTGDLFGSLKCDCGDQLRSTVRWMAENGGGVLLYLDQEGRGNGIANKMRAYRLQAQGYDTYDADEMLGFEKDQRHFAFAAEMLKQLGVTRVRMLTNNPVKIAAMREAGLDVVAELRVIGRPSSHNVPYLESKRDRAGHLIDMDALASQPLIDE